MKNLRELLHRDGNSVARICGTSCSSYLPLQKDFRAVRELGYTNHQSPPMEMLQKYAGAQKWVGE
jgi:hypothetical protein